MAESQLLRCTMFNTYVLNVKNEQVFSYYTT